MHAKRKVHWYIEKCPFDRSALIFMAAICMVICVCAVCARMNYEFCVCENSILEHFHAVHSCMQDKTMSRYRQPLSISGCVPCYNGIDCFYVCVCLCAMHIGGKCHFAENSAVHFRT